MILCRQLLCLMLPCQPYKLLADKDDAFSLSREVFQWSFLHLFQSKNTIDSMSLQNLSLTLGTTCAFLRGPIWRADVVHLFGMLEVVLIKIAGNIDQKKEHEVLAGVGCMDMIIVNSQSLSYTRKVDVEKGLASVENKEAFHLPEHNHEKHEEESIAKLKEKLRLAELSCSRLQVQYQILNGALLLLFKVMMSLKTTYCSITVKTTDAAEDIDNTIFMSTLFWKYLSEYPDKDITGAAPWPALALRDAIIHGADGLKSVVTPERNPRMEPVTLLAILRDASNHNQSLFTSIHKKKLVRLRLQKDSVNRTAKSMDLILLPKCCTIMPAKIHPTPKIKEQEHRVCEVTIMPRPGMARMAMSMAIETPACQQN
ncbi:hypothetical protein BDR04DRAFT_1117055 [Suillus decipiens]|nr:hypothetical protein BDR04DRAFT_1117055 [Suillus decipiens]